MQCTVRQADRLLTECCCYNVTDERVELVSCRNAMTRSLSRERRRRRRRRRRGMDIGHRPDGWTGINERNLNRRRRGPTEYIRDYLNGTMEAMGSRREDGAAPQIDWICLKSEYWTRKRGRKNAIAVPFPSAVHRVSLSHLSSFFLFRETWPPSSSSSSSSINTRA